MDLQGLFTVRQRFADERHSLVIVTTVVCVLGSLTLGASKAESLPMHPNSDCNRLTGSTGWNLSPGEPIGIYVENDFAAELNQCLPTSSPSRGIYESHIRNSILAAASTWTSQTRSAPFEYRGTVTADDPIGACSQMGSSASPRVFINFVEGCQDLGQGCEEGTWGYAIKIPGCTNGYSITVYGDSDTFNLCVPPTRDFRFDGEGGHENDTRDFQAFMVHEIGHSLDIDDDPGFSSIMETGTPIVGQAPAGRVWRRHLYPYDLDCTDDPIGHRGERDLRHRWEALKSDGTWWSVGSSSTSTGKAALSGGFLRASSWNDYGIVVDNKIAYEYAGINGTIPFSNTSNIVSGWNATNLYRSPVLFSPLEKTGTNQAHRMNYTKRWPAPPLPIANIDPPRLRYLRSDNRFSSGGSGAYQACVGTACTSSVALRSHLPFVATYDEVSATSVFARVNTDRHLDKDDVSLTDHGKIFIHPGFSSPSTYFKLREGVVVGNIGGLPSEPYDGVGNNPDFSYTQRTDWAPALACAPNSAGWTYNCLVAWVDRGTPDMRILYTYFRINPATFAVEFKNLITPPFNQDVWEISGSSTTGHLSAAFFNGRFYLAWKSNYAGAYVTHDVEYAYTSTMTGWSGVLYRSGTDGVIDPPTWTSVNVDQTREVGLVWTEVRP